MKFLIVKLIFFFSLIGTSFCNENIRFININFIINNSDAGKNLNEILDSKNKKISSELNKIGKKLEEKNLNELKTLKGAIIYSSTSAITKKFAANAYDKNLSQKLISSENKILSIFRKYSINCVIIRPTIIYGIYKDLDDRNFTKIIRYKT